MVSNIEESIKWLIKKLSPEEKKPAMKKHADELCALVAAKEMHKLNRSKWIHCSERPAVLTHTVSLLFVLMKKLRVFEDEATVITCLL